MALTTHAPATLAWYFLRPMRLAVAPALLLAACAHVPEKPPPMADANVLPVLCVHGIFDKGTVFDPLATHLRAAGWAEVESIDLVPNDASVDVPDLAEQVAAAAERLRQRTGAHQIDVVAFSMGSLVSRWWIQKLGGKARVRRFVSISGPHHGTLTAYFSWTPGGASMRYGSPVLRALESDPDPWGAVQVTSLWTPLDLMIIPASSSRLPRAAERTFWVPFHPHMLTDRPVQDAVQRALLGDPP